MKKILYTLRDFRINNELFAWDDPNWNYSNNLYWKFSKLFIDILIKFKDKYDITLKLYPEDNYKNLFKSYLIDNASSEIKLITNEKSYEKLVLETDLFIFDWPSTPFFKASQTDKKIFIYTSIELNELAVNAISSRAELFFNYEDFKIALSKLLSLEESFINNKKEIFTEKYLTNLPYSKKIDIIINYLKKI